MKRLNSYLLIAFALFAAFTSCDEKSPNNPVEADGYGYNFTNTLNTYVDDVVLKTYSDLKEKAWGLHAAVEKFKAAPSQSGLDAVCAAWRAARVPWEQSEGFLYGPAGKLSLDPSLDSWPLDKSQIDAVIANAQLEITQDAIASSRIHGFHTIEYLIFSDGKPKTYTNVTPRQIDYLVVATEFLRNDCLKLWASWNGAEGITGKDKTLLEEIEFNAAEWFFSKQFKNAGKAGSSFASQDEAIDQIVDGCVDIATEVGAQKIGGPSTSGNVLDVESWYSWNSIEDFSNNIISIRNSYFGGIGKTAATATENSLSAFVKSKNSTLNTEIAAAIDKAYKAINNDMERPFRNHLTGAKIEAAKTACSDLEKSFGKIKGLKK